MTPNLREQSAVIAGVFSDYKLVRTRSVVQVIVEIPVERQADVFAALGYPMPGQEIHVAVARLDPSAGKSQQPQTKSLTRPTLAEGASPKERYAAMSPAEQAVTRSALLPKDERFCAWAAGQLYGRDMEGLVKLSEDLAAKYIRDNACGGKSRKLISEVPEYLDRFLALELEFKIATGEAAAPR